MNPQEESALRAVRFAVVVYVVVLFTVLALMYVGMWVGL